MRGQRNATSDTKRDGWLSRRNFLKGAGVVTGAMVFGPYLRDFVTPDSSPATKIDTARIGGRYTIGVLVPESNVYPAVGPDLINGLTLGFRQFEDIGGKWTFDLVTEHIGTRSSLAVEKARKLVHENRVDIVVGVLSTHAIQDLRDTFSETRTPLIANTVGEKVVTQAESSPYVFYNSLNYWQSNKATGEWAAQNVGRKAFIASSFYESGYDTIYAFRHGFEGIGGEVVGNYITHMKPDSDELALSIKAIEEAKPDFVYGFYSGNDAVDFVRAYNRSPIGRRIPLLGSAFMVEDDVLSDHGGRAVGIRSGFTWSRDLQTSENTTFTSAYKSWSGRSPGPFAVLGYDSARLIVGGVSAVEGDTSRTVQFLGALANAEFDSPRGRLEMSPHNHGTTSPIYLREVRGSGNDVVAELKPVGGMEDLGMAMVSESGMRSGWIDAYLSV